MNKEIFLCLLCDVPLDKLATWEIFASKKFPTVICENCLQDFVYTEQVSALDDAIYQYNAKMKDFMQRFKFMGDIVLAHVFSAQLHAKLATTKASIVPIPMHPDKLKERTFSQVHALLQCAQLPYEDLLIKTTTQVQSTKNRQQRLQSSPLFALKDTAQLAPKAYLLFDDIRTTGTTLKHAKSLLLANGATNVTTFTLAQSDFKQLL